MAASVAVLRKAAVEAEVPLVVDEVLVLVLVLLVLAAATG